VRYLPFIIPRQISFLARNTLTSCRRLLSVSFKKQENLSTGMGLSPGSNPSIWESAGLS